MKEEKAKKAIIDEAFEHFLVDGTRSATEEDENEEIKTFTSVNEALQFLANLTCSKIIISQ